MKKKIKLKSAVIGILFCVLLFTFDIEKAKAEDPTLISNCEELQAIIDNLAGSYIQTADFSCEGVDFIPIGDDEDPFTGTFDGDNKIISDLTIEGDDYVGLFGFNEGAVQNVGLEDVDISGVFPVGSLVGHNAGEVINSYAKGEISSIDDCLGGLVGENENGSITNSFAEVDVVAIGDLIGAGGLVGCNLDSISNSYATGNVIGDSDGGLIGGLIGMNDGEIINSYTTGNVSGDGEEIVVGGFVALNAGEISNSYATGLVTIVGLDNMSGGLVAYDFNNGGTVSYSYWDKETTGQEQSDGMDDIYGKTTAEMKTQSTFQPGAPNNWDFETIWRICSSANGGYPCLQWQDGCVVEEEAEEDSIVEEQAQRAFISSWKAFLYDDPESKLCTKKIRFEIKGKHFDSDAKVRVGGKKPFDADRKSSKKIIAKFCYNKFFGNKTSFKKEIKVTNPGADANSAKKKVDVRNIGKAFNETELTMQTFEGIQNIQKALIQLKYLDAQYVTGFYGPLTAQAVRKFQADNGLPQTGTVGTITRANLVEKLK